MSKKNGKARRSTTKRTEARPDLKKYDYDSRLGDDEDLREGLRGDTAFTQNLKDRGFGNSLYERDDD